MIKSWIASSFFFYSVNERNSMQSKNVFQRTGSKPGLFVIR